MRIEDISYYFPEKVLTSLDLAKQFPEWSIEKIVSKVGIKNRHISADDEYASDLAVKAANKLFDNNHNKNDIDYLIFCTQSPDYILPTTACLVQKRLGLRTNIGAIDVNLGCSGYVYSLSLAYGLLQTSQVNNILILTSDTYSKYLDSDDKCVRTIFGDGATATLVTKDELVNEKPLFLFGTDGSGADNLIIRSSGVRGMNSKSSYIKKGLYMNGAEIMNFTLSAVPDLYNALLNQSGHSSNEIDYFVFHQANRHILESLRSKLKIDVNKFFSDLEDSGNTVSSTIPIALSRLIKTNKIKRHDRLMLLGFGVGYSWAGCIIKW